MSWMSRFDLDLFGRDFWTESPPGVDDPLGSLVDPLQLFLLVRSAADIPHCSSTGQDTLLCSGRSF